MPPPRTPSEGPQWGGAGIVEVREAVTGGKVHVRHRPRDEARGVPRLRRTPRRRDVTEEDCRDGLRRG